jgi:hypothetical protein
MRLLIIYDENECETLEDAETVANLVQLTFDTDGWELGMDTVHIEIVQEDNLA